MGARVEMPGESAVEMRGDPFHGTPTGGARNAGGAADGAGGSAPPLELRLLGAMTASRAGVPLALPASRKVRALLAYLSLAPHPVTRSHLCELLWDVPNDPRGELRWCLSKIRGVVDAPDRQHIRVAGDTVQLDLTDCSVDAIEVAIALRDGAQTLDLATLRALVARFEGDFLEGLEIDRSPAFDGWLGAQRRRFRGYRTALLERLVDSIPDEEAFDYLETWRELAPFDLRVHERILTALVRCGRIHDGEEHLEATVRLFAAEDIDCAPVRDAWRSARSRAEGTPRQAASVSVAAPPEERRQLIEPGELLAGGSRRASVAVMPFADRSGPIDRRGGPADALVHDIITRLAKLRSLFVIAQGTVFALQERGVGAEQAGRMLNVDYIVDGSIQPYGEQLTVSVELTETRTARILWTEVFDYGDEETFSVLDRIGNSIVASIASEIEAVERNRAILKPPNSLDAWEAHHRGLWHMYRFNRADNELARHFFETSVRLDPTFSRAYAGLSFTHFQSAFQHWGLRETDVACACEAARQALMVDDRDPAAHWAMGRALWLNGEQDQSVLELERAIDLSPNFAMGHYSLAFVHSQAGDAEAAVRASDQSRQLSPFDPMLFAMMGARAMALVRLGRFDEAAEWGMRAASRPNAHAHVLAIAAYSLALAGRLEEARTCFARIRALVPDYRAEDFLTAMRFHPDAAALFREAAKRIGIR